MPEKVHRCVDKIKGEKGEDSAWAICNASLKEQVANGLAIAGVKEFTTSMQEHHNPLDIPFGHEVDEGGVGSGIKGHLSKAGAMAGSYLPDLITSGVDVLSGVGMTEGGIGSGRKAQGSPVRDPFPNPSVKAPRSPKAHTAMPQKANKMPMTETCTPCEMDRRLKSQIIQSKL